uniref:Putative Polysaccharide deacetylase n=1 Tax=mine drainage metagenome TaxID=410659 RepID=E6PV92_9ZZZZ
MKRVSILMYHGLYSNERELESIDAEDRPYALSTREFRAQLSLLRLHGVPVLDPAALERGHLEQGGVVITFDDGHASNAELALPLLREHAMKAAFFITTGFVGQRPGYCSWEQVRELATNGMLVGGHGHTHRFLSDVSGEELRSELQTSQAQLTQALRRPAAQMSFPGGRFDAQSIAAAQAAGFAVLHGSAVGTLAAQAAAPAGPMPRIAIRPGMTHPIFMAYAQGRATRMVRAQLASQLKGMVKRLIGNERYHQLYARLKG